MFFSLAILSFQTKVAGFELSPLLVLLSTVDEIAALFEVIDFLLYQSSNSELNESARESLEGCCC